MVGRNKGIDIECIDCKEGMKKLCENEIDLIVTSPPYYNAREYAKWGSYEEYKEFIKEVFKEGYRVLKEGRMCVINISTVIESRAKRSEESKRIAIPFHMVCWMEELGYKFIDDIIWVKPEGASKNRNGVFYRNRKPVAYKPNIVNEYILVFQKPFKDGGLIDKVIKGYEEEVVEASKVVDGYERSNVWYMNPETKVKGHTAPYPIELASKIVAYYSYKGDKVLDMFNGSGTTGIACKRLGRAYKGYEIHEEYVKLSKDRLKKEE